MILEEGRCADMSDVSQAVPLVIVLALSGAAAIVALLAFAFWVWMLVDCLMYETDQGNSRLIWALVILFAHFIGAVIYFFAQRARRTGSPRETPPPPPLATP